MVSKFYKGIVIPFFVVTVFSSCVLDTEEASTSFLSSDDYEIVSNSLNIPNDLPNFSNSSEEMRDYVFDAKAMLGRVLFHDKNLSIDNSVSCESCHHQAHGFADEVAFSEGINGQVTERNSIAFSAVGADNSEFNPYFGGSSFSGARMFWDHRAESVTEQLEETIENTVEMGMPMEELVTKLQGVDYMQVLFENSYGVGESEYVINKEDILDALLKFLQSMNPSNSKFDQFIDSQNVILNDPNADLVQLTNLESTGLNIYNNNCASCHGAGKQQPVSSTMNNGLDMVYEDSGAGNATFKVPALRNIALSGPYMHDGRFETLEDVIQHYSEEIKPHPSKSFELPTGGFQFTDGEKEALIAFLQTLTDHSFVEDVKFSDPFK